MNIEQKVKQTLSRIKLNKKEKILVALSGGKDSATTAYLLKKFGYNIEGIHINLGMGNYSEKCLEAVKRLCKELGIKLHLYDIKKRNGKQHVLYKKCNPNRSERKRIEELCNMRGNKKMDSE